MEKIVVSIGSHSEDSSTNFLWIRLVRQLAHGPLDLFRGENGAQMEVYSVTFVAHVERRCRL